MQHIDGLPNLPRHAQAFVEQGTMMMNIAVEVCLYAFQHGVHFSLENPESSLMWMHPAMVNLIEVTGAFFITLHYCQFGEPWKKPTCLLTTCEHLRGLARTCTGCQQRCSATGKPHIALRGAVPRGHPIYGEWAGYPWTKVACAYPRALCRDYAKLLMSVSPATAPLRGGPALPTPKVHPRDGGPPAELPSCWLEVSRWTIAVSGGWDKEEHQNILECRTAVLALRRLARISRAWNRKVLIAVDSLVTLGVLARGRSSSPALLRLARQAAVVQLVAGIKPVWRWVASHHNFADGPSRREAIGLAKDTAAKAEKKALPRRTLRVLQARRPAAQRGRHW